MSDKNEQTIQPAKSPDVAFDGEALTIKPHIVWDHDDKPWFALYAKEFSIVDPFLSSCGRFVVDPVEIYEITLTEAGQLRDLNERLSKAIDEIVDSVARTYQNAFGVTDGGAAGVFFSNEDNTRPLYQLVVDLICIEFGIDARACSLHRRQIDSL